MNKIKTKPKMEKPRILERSAVMPREASRMLKKQYAGKQAERTDSSQYAIRQIEDAAQGSLSFTPRITRHMKHKPKPESKYIPVQKYDIMKTTVSNAPNPDTYRRPLAGVSRQHALHKARNYARQKAAKQAVKRSGRTIKKSFHFAEMTGRVIVRAVSSTISMLVSLCGGTTVLVAVLLIALIGAMAASPFGIFFSGERPAEGEIPLSVAVGTINAEFSDRIQSIQTSFFHDRVVLNGHISDWPEVVAVFATRTTGNEASENAMDVVTIDEHRVDLLREVFWDMNKVTHYIETIQHDSGEDSWTEYVLHIVIENKTYDEMAYFYDFNNRQIQAMHALISYRDMLNELIGSIGISSADALKLIDNLPADLAADRKALIKAACSLVGKVNYFWGGKSSVIGWDSRWGTIEMVTAAGNSTTGTYQVFGLDCSGFVTWAYINATGNPHSAGSIGHGTSNQRDKATDIPWDDAIPGDLAFYPDNSHVGIVAGHDDSGNLLVIHCASGANNVVISDAKKVGFTVIARPDAYQRKTGHIESLLYDN